MPSYSPDSVAQTLLFHLARTPGPVHRDQLAEMAGTTESYAGRVLSRMVKRGRLKRSGRGTYELAG